MAIMTAYRQASYPPEQVAERLAVCFALEQYARVPNWAQTNHEGLLDDSCRQLRNWLRLAQWNVPPVRVGDRGFAYVAVPVATARFP
jgi:hypothetical protein